jgi:hypothetical protein
VVRVRTAKQDREDTQETASIELDWCSNGRGVPTRSLVQRLPFHSSASDPETATQNAVDVQATPWSELPLGNVTVRATDQPLPFQRSAVAPPTAVQKFADGHDTPDSVVWPGVDFTDHPWPFHCSARDLPDHDPTAVQSRPALHETALSALAWVPSVQGPGWICHRAPFHRSIKSILTPAAVVNVPTAVQAVLDEHATPFSAPPMAPRGTRTGSRDQLRPFHRSASGRLLPPPTANRPAAMQAPGAEHETDASWPVGTVGSGTS